MEIRVDDLQGAEIIALLKEHLAWMEHVSPPESRHALDLGSLQRPEITFWTIWRDAELAGCGAIKALDAHHAELKSMRTAQAHQRQGVASVLLEFMLAEAKRRRYQRLSLETGSMDYFQPARRLYLSFGFEPCDPFGSYVADPNSVFMSKRL